MNNPRNGTAQNHRSAKAMMCPLNPPNGRETPTFPSPWFPQEIIGEILSNLSVKSLVRFRCVSKSLKSLISDPVFIKKHLNRTQNDPKLSKKRVLMKTSSTQNPDRCSIKSFNLSDTNEDSIVNTTEFEYPSTEVSRNDMIVGSCNGLICIAVREYKFFLVNPALRVFKKLPSLCIEVYTVYGFGFVASEDDYKVVRVFCYSNKTVEDGYMGLVTVYSLRDNYWRRIDDMPYRAPANQVMKHVDGTLNWSAYRGRDTGSYIIVSLDLAHETYREVMQPCYGDDEADRRILGVLDGCLCLLCDYWRRSCADLWVMKEYGKRESWTLLVSLSCNAVPRNACFGTPLFVSGSGEIWLCFGKDCIEYNPKEDVFRILEIPDFADSSICPPAHVYEESLVSPIAFDHHR
ncbi:hypothetical protein like AT3G23880 [Hibiscus trionum]|uniref:F-box domain-containing protein n=1 Tax=Hibiscus trionum TaxID=183268 RepID=A0A9W7IGI0_HIBTR|nr:hypothetical protein like AT3G23880 [Hibiscus trionum]